MRTLILISLLTACSTTLPGTDDPGGKQEPGMALVCDSNSWPVSEDETLLLGFTPAEAMAAIEGTSVQDAELDDGGRPEISITIMQMDGPLTYVDRFDPYTGEDSPDCADALSVPVDLILVTGDGSFEFDVSTRLTVNALDTFSISMDLEIEDNRGSFAVEDDGSETPSFRLEHRVLDEEKSGELAVVSEGSDGAAVWISSTTVMTWSALDE